MQPASSPPKWHNQLPANDHKNKTQHNLDAAVEIVNPPKCGFSVVSPTKQGLEMSVQEQAEIDKTTKKLEELMKQTKKAVEWMQHQTKKSQPRNAMAMETPIFMPTPPPIP